MILVLMIAEVGFEPTPALNRLALLSTPLLNALRRSPRAKRLHPPSEVVPPLRKPQRPRVRSTTQVFFGERTEPSPEMMSRVNLIRYWELRIVRV